MTAATWGHLVAVRALLEGGADVSLTNKQVRGDALEDVIRFPVRCSLRFSRFSWSGLGCRLRCQGKNAVDLACSGFLVDQSNRAEIQKLIQEWAAPEGDVAVGEH